MNVNKQLNKNENKLFSMGPWKTLKVPNGSLDPTFRCPMLNQLVTAQSVQYFANNHIALCWTFRQSDDSFGHIVLNETKNMTKAVVWWCCEGDHRRGRRLCWTAAITDDDWCESGWNPVHQSVINNECILFKLVTGLFHYNQIAVN